MISPGISQGDYAFLSWERERKSHRWRYWQALQLARNEYERVSNTTIFDGSKGFYDYLVATYGIRPVLTSAGEITESYEVIDEPLATFFVLKFFK